MVIMMPGQDLPTATISSSSALVMTCLLFTNSCSICARMAQPPPKVKQPILKKKAKMVSPFFNFSMHGSCMTYSVRE